MSLKKLAPFRNTSSEESKLKKSKRKKLKELRSALLKRQWGEHLPTGQVTGEVDLQRYDRKRKIEEKDGVSSEQPVGKKKRVGKKERQRLRLLDESNPA